MSDSFPETNLELTEDQVVSYDNRDIDSSTFGAWADIAFHDHFVKFLFWYDNKFGYSNRVVYLLASEE